MTKVERRKLNQMNRECATLAIPYGSAMTHYRHHVVCIRRAPAERAELRKRLDYHQARFEAADAQRRQYAELIGYRVRSDRHMDLALLQTHECLTEWRLASFRAGRDPLADSLSLVSRLSRSIDGHV